MLTLTDFFRDHCIQPGDCDGCPYHHGVCTHEDHPGVAGLMNLVEEGEMEGRHE